MSGNDISTLDVFFHIRIISGFGVGLCMSRLLAFAAGFIQHPKRQHLSAIHTAWVFFIFIYIVSYWWEILQERANYFDGGVFYFLQVLHISFLYFICVTITPENIDDYEGYYDYFFSRRIWLFCVFMFSYCVDFFGKNLAVKSDIYDYFELLLVSILIFSALISKIKWIQMIVVLMMIFFNLLYIFLYSN